MQDNYAKETEEKYGNTNEYNESQTKTSEYTDGDWDRINAEADQIFDKFIGKMNSSPEDCDHIVKEWQEHISKYYYKCDTEVLAGIGMLYVSDDRFRENINSKKDGLAPFMSKAIASYCKKELQNV